MPAPAIIACSQCGAIYDHEQPFRWKRSPRSGWAHTCADNGGGAKIRVGLMTPARPLADPPPPPLVVFDFSGHALRGMTMPVDQATGLANEIMAACYRATTAEGEGDVETQADSEAGRQPRPDRADVP